MPPTASFEMWGLQGIVGPAYWGQPHGQGCSGHLASEAAAGNCCGSVHIRNLCVSFGSGRLSTCGWRRAISFRNTLTAQHDGDLFRQVTVDA